MKIPSAINNNKSIYATYSVMALNNAFSVLNHIAKVVGLEESAVEDEDIWNHSVIRYLDEVRRNGDADHTRTDTITTKLFASMPFLRVLAEQQREWSNNNSKGKKQLEIIPEHFYWPLSNALRVMKAYRDLCEHSVFEDSKWNDGSDFLTKNEQRLPAAMEKYFEVTLRNVKDRYNYSTDDLRFIQDFRYKKVPQPGSRYPKMELDLNFFLCLKSYNDDRTKKFHLSAVGVTMLICLFLEKQYINIFLSKIKNSLFADRKPKLSNAEMTVIRRTFGINSIVLSKERIRSEKSDMSIALDMINELKRCPRELFDTLSFADQDAFRIMSDDHQEVLQMRHTDRFVPMMLQYIDYNRLFSQIRFGVNMGKLRYLFCSEKHCIDGQTRVRVLEQPINAFGRLQELEDKRRSDNGCFINTKVKIRDFENVKRDDADAANYPYIVDTYSHYMLDNNKIMLCFGDNIPEIFRDDSGKWVVTNYIPHCMMSALEVPAMMFHMHLYKAENTERCIRQAYSRYVKLFNAMKAGVLTADNLASFGIKECDMPQRVVQMVRGTDKRKSFWTAVNKQIAEMIAECDQRLDKLNNDRKKITSGNQKMGKRGFVTIQPGRLADFLANDIVKFQRTAKTGEAYGTDRITGLNYRVMQASIATFNNSIEANNLNNLKRMFEAANLTQRESKTSHPFLYAVLMKNPENTIELYEKYLIQRKRYLQNLKQEIDKAKQLPDLADRNVALRQIEITFANRNSARWAKCDAESYKALGEDYLEYHAIELPRQLFDDEIKAKLKELPQMQDVDFDHANVTYLIAEYLKRVFNDDFQAFYSWNRNYRYMDMLIGRYERNKALAKTYTTLKDREDLWKGRQKATKAYVADKVLNMSHDPNFRGKRTNELEEIAEAAVARSRVEYQQSEKMIRRYKVQDALMFLAAIDTITLNVDFEGKRFKLNAIEPDADKGILSELMPIDFRFEIKGKHYVLHADNMKIKNYGDFYKILHDKRLPSLLDVVSDVTILDKEQLTTELSNYDNCRPRVVEMILDLEKTVYNRYPELKNKVKEIPHFNFSKLMQEVVNRGAISSSDRNVVNNIRNSFSHNSYPTPDKIRLRVATLPQIAIKLEEMFSEKSKLKE